MKAETRGRKALKPEERKPPQTTLKINDYILPFVKELKGNLKIGKVTPVLLDNLFNVLSGEISSNDTDLLAELEQFKKYNLSLVLQRDKEHHKAASLQTKVNSQRSDIKSLKEQLKTLQHKDYDCQFITKSGNRCTKQAKLKANWQGVEINVCLQHNKALLKGNL